MLAATDHLLRARELIGSGDLFALVAALEVETVEKEKKQGKARKKDFALNVTKDAGKSSKYQ